MKSNPQTQIPKNLLPHYIDPELLNKPYVKANFQLICNILNQEIKDLCPTKAILAAAIQKELNENLKSCTISEKRRKMIDEHIINIQYFIKSNYKEIIPLSYAKKIHHYIRKMDVCNNQFATDITKMVLNQRKIDNETYIDIRKQEMAKVDKIPIMEEKELYKICVKSQLTTEEHSTSLGKIVEHLNDEFINNYKHLIKEPISLAKLKIFNHIKLISHFESTFKLKKTNNEEKSIIRKIIKEKEITLEHPLMMHYFYPDYTKSLIQKINNYSEIIEQIEPMDLTTPIQDKSERISRTRTESIFSSDIEDLTIRTPLTSKGIPSTPIKINTKLPSPPIPTKPIKKDKKERINKKKEIEKRSKSANPPTHATGPALKALFQNTQENPSDIDLASISLTPSNK